MQQLLLADWWGTLANQNGGTEWGIGGDIVEHMGIGSIERRHRY